MTERECEELRSELDVALMSIDRPAARDLARQWMTDFLDESDRSQQQTRKLFMETLEAAVEALRGIV
jgi:hypothetical protein